MLAHDPGGLKRLGYMCMTQLPPIQVPAPLTCHEPATKPCKLNKIRRFLASNGHLAVSPLTRVNRI